MLAPSRNRLPNAFSLLLIVLLCTSYFAPFADLDFTWQVRTGKQIVETGQLRPIESFTYTIAGRQGPEFEWLYEVILWGVWQVLGFGGLKLLKTLLVATPVFLVCLRLRREDVRWPGLAMVILTSILVLFPAWNLRPLYCTTIGLLLVSGWLHDHCTGRRPLTWWLPLVMLVWSNLHPGVIAGQGLLLGAIGWEWLNRWCKLNKPLDRAACLRLSFVGGLGLAATFISPDPIERLLYPFRPEVAHPIQRIFVEMQPLYTFIARPPYTFGLVYIVAALVGLSVVLRFRQYRLWEVAVLLGLAGLGNLAIRSLQDWLMVMLALGGPHVAVLLRRLRETRKIWLPRLAALPRPIAAVAGGAAQALVRIEVSGKRLLTSEIFCFQHAWPAVTLVALITISLIPPLAWQMPIQNGHDWPVAAVDWIESQGIQGRFFGLPDHGSYLTWRLGDRAKCYVDTRGFFFPAELLEDSYYVTQLGPDWRSRLDRIVAKGTDYFLIETQGTRGELWLMLQPHIERPLYCDDKVALLSTTQVQQALFQIDHAATASLARATVSGP
jgi:hypothetical protein